MLLRDSYGTMLARCNVIVGLPVLISNLCSVWDRDYDSEISRYLETEYGNDINKAETCDFDKMLEYNGLDSLFEYKLAYKQIKELGLKEKLQYFEGRRAT